MAIIWGFDLGEMSWGAFGHKRMFDRQWHLRRERIIVYKLAMFACLAAECAATYSLNKYEKLQVHAEALSSTVHLENNDLINAEITTIVFCVLVACLFGADFFFLVFFPRRTYPTWYNITKRVCAVVITTGVFVSALISTWVVACREAILTGMTAQELAATFPRPPLNYSAWPTNIAYVVLLWIGFIFTMASTALMFVAVRHDERHGVEARGGVDTEREKTPQSPRLLDHSQ